MYHVPWCFNRLTFKRQGREGFTQTETQGRKEGRIIEENSGFNLFFFFLKDPFTFLSIFAKVKYKVAPFSR